MLLLGLMLVGGCGDPEEPINVSATVEAELTSKVDIHIDDIKSKKKADLSFLAKAERLEGVYLIWKGGVTFDLAQWLKEHDLSSVDVQSLKLIDKVIVTNNIAGNKDLAKLKGLKVISLKDRRVIAKVQQVATQNGVDQALLTIVSDDFKPLLDGSGKIDLAVVADEIEGFEDIEKIDLTCAFTAEVKVTQRDVNKLL